MFLRCPATFWQAFLVISDQICAFVRKLKILDSRSGPILKIWFYSKIQGLVRFVLSVSLVELDRLVGLFHWFH